MNELSLDPARLENVKHLDGGAIKAACPVCRKAGSDKSGDHLLIQASGKFGCATHPDDHEHRAEIFKLTGTRPDPAPASNGRAKQFDCAYDYQDASGKLSFQVVRFKNPKTFKQRRPGEWLWNMAGVDRVLYRLLDVLKAKAGGKPVFIAEGEKDCDCLAKQGFTASTNPGGAGKWLDGYSETLRGAEVAIIPDKDAPGRAHAALVASKLHGVAKSVRVIELPDTNGKPVKDAFDYFAAGGDAAEIVALIDAAPIWTPGQVEADTKPNPWLSLVEDAADIVIKTIPPVVEIVGDIVAEKSKLVIASGSKSFKTWLSIHLGLCVAGGLRFLERFTTRRRVVYVNLELQPRTFDRRVQAIAKATGITVDRAWFYHLPLRGKLAGLTVFEIVNRIIAVANHFRAEVVICDPVYKMNVEGDENSSRDQTNFFNQLDRITTEAGCTLILNDHFSKGNQSEKDPLAAR
jgi:hypothetical protein